MSDGKEETVVEPEIAEKSNLITIQFSPEELQVIVNLLDVAVRTRGLDVAANAVVIHEKIKRSIM